MQFIEHLFGLYPDGVNGTLEISLVAIMLSMVVLRAALLRIAKRARTNRG
jgi:hypothetical protein